MKSNEMKCNVYRCFSAAAEYLCIRARTLHVHNKSLNRVCSCRDMAAVHDERLYRFSERILAKSSYARGIELKNAGHAMAARKLCPLKTVLRKKGAQPINAHHEILSDMIRFSDSKSVVRRVTSLRRISRMQWETSNGKSQHNVGRRS